MPVSSQNRGSRAGSTIHSLPVDSAAAGHLAATGRLRDRAGCRDAARTRAAGGDRLLRPRGGAMAGAVRRRFVTRPLLVPRSSGVAWVAAALALLALLVERRFVTRPLLVPRSSGVAWVAAALALLALLVAGPARATFAPATPGCDNVTQPGIVAGTTPILFVHGINSDPTTWTSGTVSGTSQAPLNYIESALGPSEVTGYTFDWSKYSGFHAGSTLSWVTGPPAPGPGQLLAQAIECVAGKAGHKVIIIAHSMGGLVTEYASSLDSASIDIAAVFTLGTPFRGSWLDSSP